MRRHGADVSVYGPTPRTRRVAGWAPERIAVAGGDGTVGVAAPSSPGGSACRWR